MVSFYSLLLRLRILTGLLIYLELFVESGRRMTLLFQNKIEVTNWNRTCSYMNVPEKFQDDSSSNRRFDLLRPFHFEQNTLLFFCCKKSAMSSVHKRNFLALLLKKIRNEFCSNRKSSALAASKTNLGAVQFIETILQLCCFNFFWDEFSSNKKSYDLLVSKKIRDEFSSETRNLITLFCHNKSGTNSVQTDILWFSCTGALQTGNFIALLLHKKILENPVHRRNLITLLFQFFAGDESEAGTSSVQTGKLMALLFPKKIWEESSSYKRFCNLTV